MFQLQVCYGQHHCKTSHSIQYRDMILEISESLLNTWPTLTHPLGDVGDLQDSDWSIHHRPDRQTSWPWEQPLSVNPHVGGDRAPRKGTGTNHCYSCVPQALCPTQGLHAHSTISTAKSAILQKGNNKHNSMHKIISNDWFKNPWLYNYTKYMYLVHMQGKLITKSC